jgi:hypothetical protein
VSVEAEIVRDCQDNLTLAEVATRLRKSKRWLQAKLADDRCRPPTQRRFQYHARIGRTPVWTEAQYLALRDALKAESAESPDSSSSSAAASGTSAALLSRKDAESAFARVLTLKRCRRSGQKQMPSGTGSRRKSEGAPGRSRARSSPFDRRRTLPEPTSHEAAWTFEHRLRAGRGPRFWPP